MQYFAVNTMTELNFKSSPVLLAPAGLEALRAVGRDFPPPPPSLPIQHTAQPSSSLAHALVQALHGVGRAPEKLGRVQHLQARHACEGRVSSEQAAQARARHCVFHYLGEGRVRGVGAGAGGRAAGAAAGGGARQSRAARLTQHGMA